MYQRETTYVKRIFVVSALFVVFLPALFLHAQDQTVPDTTANVLLPKFDGVDTLGKTTDVVVQKTESFRTKMITNVKRERQKIAELPTKVSTTETPGTNVTNAHNRLLMFILDMALFILTNMWVFYVFVVVLALIIMKALG